MKRTKKLGGFRSPINKKCGVVVLVLSIVLLRAISQNYNYQSWSINEGSEAAKFECPIKIFVYDLGFVNRTKHLKKGFNATSIKKNSFTYITEKLTSEEESWFIIQKFLWHSSCTVERAQEADFFIIPLASRNVNEANRMFGELEHSFNHTLFRRRQRDHIITCFHNTKKGYEFLSSPNLSNRSKELITPMIKTLVDIFGWWYSFSSRNTRSDLIMNYDRLLSVVRGFTTLKEDTAFLVACN